MKFVVLINNELQARNGRPVYASKVNNKWFFYETKSRKIKDITEEINLTLERIYESSLSHYLFPFTVRRKPNEHFHYEVNEILHILHIRSEVYQIHVKLFEEYTGVDSHFEMLNRDLGENVNLIPFFKEAQESFLIDSIYSYSRIVNYIEAYRTNIILNNTYNMGLALKIDDERWMNIVFLKMVSIDNPFLWLFKRPLLNYSKLLKYFRDEEVDYNFNLPQVFQIHEKSEHLTCYLATPTDILTFLNINIHKALDMSSMFVVQLVGSCLLKALGFPLKTYSLPSTTPYYTSIDVSGDTIDESWDKADLSGEIIEFNSLSISLEKELGSSLAGELFPEFERMRLT